MGKPNPQHRRAKKAARRKQRLTSRQTSPERSSRQQTASLAPLPAPGPTLADLGWLPPVSRLVPLETPRTLEQLARRHGMTDDAHVSVDGQWWTPEEFRALKWIDELCDDEADQARDDILAHYGEKIPADLALLDFSARNFIGVTTWNDYCIETEAEHLTALAQTPDLREALGILHREGWITPMADGLLSAPGLFLQPVPPAPSYVRRWPTASHLHARFRLDPLPADEIPTLDELLYACEFQFAFQGLHPVAGTTWTPKQFSRHPWLAAGEGEPDPLMVDEYERILIRYGDHIPADQAVLDLAAVALPYIVTGNFDVLDDEQLVLAFTQTDDLRQAFGTLHRDGLLVPLANGLLLAPGLAKVIDET
ncbi:hypothetical protein [Nonomuraea dietziae]|uniref:Uncharacterized protein n=2 Tax=Nonomuraea dietziae TaxID=65515 RepID=A0A7W5UX31_9ACTN|nr:hypothetical protein [Nonomuraea dietziae]MBB3724589.1 hypothetical protein [Nonomuraea dietziae]